MLTLIYCTRKANPLHKEHIIESSGLDKNIQVIEIVNKGESLTKSYNRGLEQAKNHIVVFCHDDIDIKTDQWGNKLLQVFSKNPKYGIIGLAGSKSMPSSGKWWTKKRDLYGVLLHNNKLLAFSKDIGENIEDLIILDGFFFAIDKRKIKEQFNETVEGFHFYDVTFCFENFLKGVKIGLITSIMINHKSNAYIDPTWEINRAIFAESFKNELPVSIQQDIYNNKNRVLIGYFNSVFETVHENLILKLIKELIEQDCDISLISNVDIKIINEIKELGVKLYSLQNPPGFKLGDGKWLMNTVDGRILSIKDKFYKINNFNFDVLYTNNKLASKSLLQFYPDIELIYDDKNYGSNETNF